MKLGFLSLIYFFFASLSQSTFSQDFFPLEVGNRWDYTGTHTAFGGFTSTYKYSMEVTGKTEFSKGMEYFILSNSLFTTPYLRVESDSLFCFNTEDSSDCFILAFNSVTQDYYTSCQFDSAKMGMLETKSLFNKADSCLNVETQFEFYTFSKTYGISDAASYSSLSEDIMSLSGCVISGITYGTLLDVDNNINTVQSLQLYQNYPNPFNPSTTISYNLPAESKVDLSLYNTLGQLVKVLVDEFQNAGSQSFVLNADDIPNGVYFYQLNAGRQIQTRKLIVLK